MVLVPKVLKAFAYTLFFADRSEEIKDFCSSFELSFGGLKSQSAVFEFDFIMDETGILVPYPVRFKIELSCFSFSDERVDPKFLLKKPFTQDYGHTHFHTFLV